MYVCKVSSVFVCVLYTFMMYPPHSLFSEHVCSIIASMLRNLKSQQRTRLHNKFTENDCEKVHLCCFFILCFFSVSFKHLD